MPKYKAFLESIIISNVSEKYLSPVLMINYLDHDLWPPFENLNIIYNHLLLEMVFGISMFCWLYW